jgi:hypothetical protein
MMTSKATTVAAYLKALPADRRATLSKVRRVIKKHLPRGYREVMNWGMISYEVPLRRYMNTYNGQPLMYAALSAQKNYVSLHLVAAYGSPALARRLRAGFRAAKKRLNMGKGCLRFRDIDDLPLGVIGEIIAAVPMNTYVALMKAAHERRRA